MFVVRQDHHTFAWKKPIDDIKNYTKTRKTPDNKTQVINITYINMFTY